MVASLQPVWLLRRSASSAELQRAVAQATRAAEASEQCQGIMEEFISQLQVERNGPDLFARLLCGWFFCLLAP